MPSARSQEEVSLLNNPLLPLFLPPQPVSVPRNGHLIRNVLGQVSRDRGRWRGGEETKGAEEKGGEGGARRRRREIGCGRSGANEPTGRGSRRSVSAREPSGLSNRSRPGQRGPATLRRAAGGGERAWLCRGEGLRWSPGGRGARGAVAPRGDVRSSWSRGLPPAADVRMVNNRERSVEGGIPRYSLRSPSSRPSPIRGRSGAWDGGAAGGEREGNDDSEERLRRLEWLAPRHLPLAGCSEEPRRAQ